HRDEERVERLGEKLDRGGKRTARGDFVAHIADDDAENRILGLVLQGLQALDQRQTGVEQRGELLGEDGELAERQLVVLGLFLEGLLLGQGLGGSETNFFLRCGRLSAQRRSLTAGSTGNECHARSKSIQSLRGNPLFYNSRRPDPPRNPPVLRRELTAPGTRGHSFMAQPARGCSLVVKLHSSKVVSRVRFPP